MLDIVETMATSDNVIRAGLTPKLRDVPNLIAGLTYTASEATKHTITPKAFGDHTTLYDPPIPEFSVARVNISGEATEKHPSINGPSILIVTQGSGAIAWQGEEGQAQEILTEGRVFFIGAKTPVKFLTNSDLEVYRAFVQRKT